MQTWVADSVDPDQTAPSGAVWSGSKLFALVSYGHYDILILNQMSIFQFLYC